jgi:hypothetical protein
MSCLLGMEKPTEGEKQLADDDAQTIRPGRSPANVSIPLPIAQAPSSGIDTIAEDFSDLDFVEDDVRLEEKVADFKVCILMQFNVICSYSSFDDRSLKPPQSGGFSIQTISKQWASHRLRQAPKRHHSQCSLIEVHGRHSDLWALQVHRQN